MPALSSSSTLTVVDDGNPQLGVLAEVQVAPDRLLELLAAVPDPRKSRAGSGMARPRCSRLRSQRCWRARRRS